MTAVALRALATAVPPHGVDQDGALEHAKLLFDLPASAWDKLAPVFGTVAVEHRDVCEPPTWFASDPSFAERNARYQHWAIALSIDAGRRAIAAAGVDPGDVGGLVFVSTTGLATPSLDARLLAPLGLRARHTHRESIFGRGCAGGVVGLAQAADRARLLGADRPVLLVVAELCSLTFRRGDRSGANVVSSALFGDGAAAAVLSAGEAPDGFPLLIGHDGVTWPDTEELMGWDFADDGMGVVLGRNIPALVGREFRASVESACVHLGVDPQRIAHHLVHPGSSGVLDAIEGSLGVGHGALDVSRAVLRDHGNMSAVTVLFVLDRFLREGIAQPGELGMMSAMGPGFSADHLVLRW